jgi:hypothetical protein
MPRITLVCRTLDDQTLLTTLALVLAASERVAPIRFATRVDAAIDIGNGIWKVSAVRVLRMLCAAKCVVEK